MSLGTIRLRAVTGGADAAARKAVASRAAELQREADAYARGRVASGYAHESIHYLALRLAEAEARCTTLAGHAGQDARMIEPYLTPCAECGSPTGHMLDAPTARDAAARLYQWTRTGTVDVLPLAAIHDLTAAAGIGDLCPACEGSK